MDLSTRLSFLFGTEEYVAMRRQLVLLRESLLNHNRERKTHLICSGSLGEGVAYPESDDDLMFCFTDLRVVTTFREATEATEITDFLMVPCEFSPGYCRLLDVRGSYSDHVVHIIHEMPFVSSSLWKQYFIRDEKYIHGPCYSGAIGTSEYDHAICIRCFNWPDIANGWRIRTRSYNWPTNEMVQNIVSNDCHVVPIGDPDSPYYEHEWRISFSVAERTLMHSFNHAQFLVYNLLRFTLKRVIEKQFPNVFCSYFMKTTLFYTAEKTSTQNWQLSNLEACFKSCLSVLYNYVDNANCPNYFIPEYNMIKRKINRTNRHQILDNLRVLHVKNIVEIIHLSGESQYLNARLSPTLIEWKLDEDFMFSDHLLTTFHIVDILFHILPHVNLGCGSFHLNKFWLLLNCNPTLIRSKLIDTLWSRGVNSYCLKLMDFLFSSSNRNKHNYHLNKPLKALLKIGYRGDVTTGKLTMATYMHMIGKTESALNIIQQLLSGYPPYAIDIHRDELKKQAYMDVMCGRGFTMNYKMRHAHAPRYHLHKKCVNAFPSPLRILLYVNDVQFDSLTYSYLLECLCHVQQQNQLLLMKSLRCLVNHMDDLEVDDDIVYNRMCVGIIKYVQGEIQSACRWLGSAYVIAHTLPPPDNKEISLSAVTYIACLLNKTFQSAT
ncbi:hypothetical protein FSP39_022342 [Pinctada imbricata]|uniref:Uncharacterized protein n=1 Tax=Pinctada imbricata TaxID=66713 RepID=A0AA88Y4E6_PINIB|nr:hypothetical protein FSP39_022342 [Pinctada imbricata]